MSLVRGDAFLFRYKEKRNSYVLTGQQLYIRKKSQLI